FPSMLCVPSSALAVQTHLLWKRLDVNWFGDVVIEATTKQARPVSLHREGGQRDHRDASGARLGTEVPQRYLSFHVWELDVEQYQIRPPSAGESEPFGGRRCRDGAVALELEQVSHQLQISGVVFHDEDQLAR